MPAFPVIPCISANRTFLQEGGVPNLTNFPYMLSNICYQSKNQNDRKFGAFDIALAIFGGERNRK